MLLAFVQADGYEPMTVKAVIYIFSDPKTAEEVAKQVTTDANSACVADSKPD